MINRLIPKNFKNCLDVAESGVIIAKGMPPDVQEMSSLHFINYLSNFFGVSLKTCRVFVFFNPSLNQPPTISASFAESIISV